MNEEKIRAILEWKKPKNVTNLKGFVGIYIYYRKFVKGFSHQETPLTYLTKKGAFTWTSTAQEAFHRLKQVMNRCPVFALPNFTKPFILCAMHPVNELGPY